MADTDPDLDAIRSARGRLGAATRLQGLDAAGRAKLTAKARAVKDQLAALEDEVDPEHKMTPAERRREAKLLLTIREAEAELTVLAERRRQREEAALAERLERLQQLQSA